MPKNVKLKLTLSDSTIVESNTFTIPDGPTGPAGAAGAPGVGFYYTTDSSTGTSGISTLLSNIMPSGIKEGDFLVNAVGKVAEVTEISGNIVSAQYRTSIKGEKGDTGPAGSPGAAGKDGATISTCEVVEV
mgnify:CR=1 FL=1